MTKGLFGKNQKINADNVNPGFLALIPLSTEKKHRNCLMTTGNGLLNDTLLSRYGIVIIIGKSNNIIGIF